MGVDPVLMAMGEERQLKRKRKVKSSKKRTREGPRKTWDYEVAECLTTRGLTNDAKNMAKEMVEICALTS